VKFYKYLRVLVIITLISVWLLKSGVASADSSLMNATGQNTSITVIHVPGDVSNLQDAISQVPDNGMIELSAGTYHAPTGGFKINDTQKAFTIRATDGAMVVLSGDGTRDILRFINSALSRGKPVVFENITFADGYSSTDGVAAGVTMQKAQATFKNCTFQNNRGNEPSTGAGGIAVSVGSTAFFFNSTWANNSAKNYGGGLAVEEHSAVYVHASQFINNRTNLPGHAVTSAGGGIHMANSILRVSNSSFESNQAGYVGGGIYAIGTWTDPVTTPQADVIIANSTFINNQSARDPGVSASFPTEGGAFHAEDQTVAKIYHSRFITNSSNIGAGINVYRSKVDIDEDVFLGNRTTGTNPATGFGGAISVTSNDAKDSSTNYGAINRPSAHLTVKNSLFQGKYGSVTITGQTAGGIYATGDVNRMFGLNGVPPMGTPDENRTVVTIDNVIFNDLDVQETPGVGGSGAGGAMMFDFVNLTMQNSLVMNSDAIGSSNSAGGGLALLDFSIANITNTTFARNTAEVYGGGIFIQGSTINLSGSNLIENTIKKTNYGSAIFSSPMEGRNLPVNGTVQNCVISNNVGQPIFDDDRTNGPINDIRYNHNQIHPVSGGTGAIVYSDSLTGGKTVAQLNSLVVQRANGTSTPKSQTANTALANAPIVGMVIAAPLHILNTTAAGDPPPPTSAYLGYAWSGGSATLDGVTVSGNAGVTGTTSLGSHTLSVGGTPFATQVAQELSPTATFTSDQNGSNLYTLSWDVQQGTFMDASIDHGVAISPVVLGSVQVSAVDDVTFCFYTIAEEGGFTKCTSTGKPLLSTNDTFQVLVGLNSPVQHRALYIGNSGGGLLTWTAQTETPNLITLETSSGQTETGQMLQFIVDATGKSTGQYTGYIDVNAGAAGSQRVTVTVKVVQNLKEVFLPVVTR